MSSIRDEEERRRKRELKKIRLLKKKKEKAIHGSKSNYRYYMGTIRKDTEV